MAWQTCAKWDDTPDGNWSTFRVRVGSPPQDFCALVSTASYHLRLPFEEQPDCSQLSSFNREYVSGSDRASRAPWSGGRAFDPHASTSLEDELLCFYFSDMLDDGYPELHRNILNESVRGRIEAALPNTGYHPPGQTVRETTQIGLHSTFVGIPPWISFYDVLRNGKRALIQSFPAMQNTMAETAVRLELAYSYTAGAWYRQYPGALSLGSYDPKRRSGPVLSTPFTMEEELLRQGCMMNLEILSFSSSGGLTGSNNNDLSFISEPLLAELDSTHPYISLPEPVCYAMARAFDLDYNTSTRLFHVSDGTRARLRNARPAFNITVGNNASQSIEIVLPYEAFEHDIQLVDGSSAYFPIRVKEDNRPCQLGRVFFQESYLSVDYGKKLFNLSAAAFPHPISAEGDRDLVFLHRPPPPTYRPAPVVSILIFGFFWLILIVGAWLVLQGALPYALYWLKRKNLKERQSKQLELWAAIHAPESHPI